MTLETLPISSVRYVKELYPRIRPSDEVIDRYRAALDRLPPIVVANGGVIVDGYHRWQAHLREGRAQIDAEDLGTLTEVEIFKESIRRNSHHGQSLTTGEKRRDADRLYRGGTHDYAEIAELLSITENTAKEYCRDARRDEVADQKAQAWDLWLDCVDSYAEIARMVDGPTDETVRQWITAARKSNALENLAAPESRQHFDVWRFDQNADKDTSYFGRLSPQVAENLFWLFSQPGQVVVDLFAGSGLTIEVAKRMGRRIWTADLFSAAKYPNLPIHTHDATEGWPAEAPREADLIFLDPPYWAQAKGKYSDDARDLGNRSLDDFYADWAKIVAACRDHLADDGHLAFIVSPAQVGSLKDGTVTDLAFDMYEICREVGLRVERRIVTTYNQSNQAGPDDVKAAREHRKLLKIYRDLVVMRRD